MKKLLAIILPITILYGCASTPEVKKECPRNLDTTTTYTGDADQCSCEADTILDAYSNQINTTGIIQISYSEDNAMHAQSCQKAINAKDKSIKLEMKSEDGKYIYGYHYPQSKYTY